jgi:hypothetical protein
MHFHILSEDLSGKKALEILIPKIISQDNTFEIHSYKGLGSLPKHLDQKVDPKVETLLNKLPMILRALGKTYLHKNACVFVICDLDRKDLKSFRQELMKTLNQCNPKPLTRFCVAIEENEAWYLGDIPAIKRAYPQAKDEILNAYINDSICGTWEYLASATVEGGPQKLINKGWWAIGEQKFYWAENIAPHMDTEQNSSPSFRYFRDHLRELSD